MGGTCIRESGAMGMGVVLLGCWTFALSLIPQAVATESLTLGMAKRVVRGAKLR